MSATFDPSLGSARDRLRFNVGDTDPAAPLLPDATYDGALALYPDPLTGERYALLMLAEGLIVRFGQQPDHVKVEGAVDLTWGERLKSWRALAGRLREELGLVSGGVATLTVGSLTRAQPAGGD